MENINKQDIGVISIVNKDGQDYVNIDLVFDAELFTPQEMCILNDLCGIMQNVIESAVLRNQNNKED